jgi:hypothetical protein
MKQNNIKTLQDIIKIAEMVYSYSYGRLFDILGMYKLFEQYDISTVDLETDDLKFLLNKIKKFKNQAQFKNFSLHDEAHLTTLKDDKNFKPYIENAIKELKIQFDKKKEILEKKLEAEKKNLINYLKTNPKDSEIPLETIGSLVKLDKENLLTLLYDLKKEKEISDFDGKTVTY